MPPLRVASRVASSVASNVTLSPMPETSAMKQAAFSASQPFAGICFIHTIAGLSYFGYYDNVLLKLITFAINVVFLVAVVFVYTPCLVNCADFDVHTMFSSGFNTKVVAFVVNCLYVYQAFMNDVLIVMRGTRIRKFFNRARDYTSNFGCTFLDSQQQKLGK